MSIQERIIGNFEILNIFKTKSILKYSIVFKTNVQIFKTIAELNFLNLFQLQIQLTCLPYFINIFRCFVSNALTTIIANV